MDVGVALEMYDLADGMPVPAPDLAAQAERAEQLGFASVWVMDHVFMERDGRRLGGHEPLTVLAHIAARTRRVRLGTLVLCGSFRHPVQLAREAAALADISGGRLILGVGAGWGEGEHRALGLPFDHLVSRLEEQLTVLRPLLRGDRVSSAGRWLHLDEASVNVTAPAPPVWVGGRGPRVLRAAARLADGWNLVWPGRDVAAFRSLLGTLREEAADAGRSPDELTPSVGLLTVVADGGRAADLPDGLRARLTERTVVAGADELAALLEEYRAAGAQHVILSCAPSPFARLDASLMDAAAGVLPRLGAA